MYVPNIFYMHLCHMCPFHWHPHLDDKGQNPRTRDLSLSISSSLPSNSLPSLFSILTNTCLLNQGVHVAFVASGGGTNRTRVAPRLSNRVTANLSRCLCVWDGISTKASRDWSITRLFSFFWKRRREHDKSESFSKPSTEVCTRSPLQSSPEYPLAQTQRPSVLQEPRLEQSLGHRATSQRSP